MEKKKKAIFSKTAPKVQKAMESKVGSGLQKGATIVGWVLTGVTTMFTIGSAIVGINKWSQERIDRSKEISVPIEND